MSKPKGLRAVIENELLKFADASSARLIDSKVINIILASINDLERRQWLAQTITITNGVAAEIEKDGGR